MRIAIIGASRGLGRVLTEVAVAKGHSVRNISRTGRPEHEPITEQVRWIMGDVAKYESGAASAVVENCDAVVVALGHSKTFGTYPANGKTIRECGTMAVIRAMQEQAVGRLVICSHAALAGQGQCGSWLERIKQQTFDRKMLRDHQRQEELVQASGLDWSIVRPWKLTNAMPNKLDSYVIAGESVVIPSQSQVVSSKALNTLFRSSRACISRISLAKWIINKLECECTPGSIEYVFKPEGEQ